MTASKWYGGNNPNSANYDPNLPPGTNKWDEEEAMADNEAFEDEKIDDWDSSDWGERFD